MEHPVACYREFAPHPALRGRVRALCYFGPVVDASQVRHRMTREVLFGPDASYSATFADADVSVLVATGTLRQPEGSWLQGAGRMGAVIMGAMGSAGPEHGATVPQMIGAYLHAAEASSITGVPGETIANRILELEELWGASLKAIAEPFVDADLHAQLALLDALLLRRLGGARRPKSAIDVSGLADWVAAQRGGVTVERMAQAAGVSRQQLTRVFRERVGMSPKRFARIARFQSTLAHAGDATVDWARVAAEAGYADQSHMIADFREFSSLTPHKLSTERRFHPFIERSRTRD